MRLVYMLARFMAPLLVRHRDRIIAQAMKRPYFHLDGYMMRYWLVEPRWWLPFSIRLHHILREDNERDYHDHPFDFCSLILQGWYFEKLPSITLQREMEANSLNVHCYKGEHSMDAWYEGEVNRHRAKDYHTIARVSNGGVWTLFVMSRKRQKWGFFVRDHKEHWRVYELRKQEELRARVQ